MNKITNNQPILIRKVGFLMKKILFILLTIILILGIKYNDYELTNNMIRFRVISNSSSVQDYLIKKKVSKKISNIIFNNYKDEKTARQELISNIDTIENEIESVFRENNYNKNFTVNYGLNYFPDKMYNNKLLKSGEYESLVITLGEGDGENYWCILYPPLCIIDENDDVTNKIEYKFKIIEMLKKIF